MMIHHDDVHLHLVLKDAIIVCLQMYRNGYLHVDLWVEM